MTVEGKDAGAAPYLCIRRVDPVDHAARAEDIERALLASLAEINTQSENQSVVLEAREGGALVGGLAAASSYGWLLIKTLWVRDDMRGAGAGRRFMAEAEEIGRAIGCHSAWLDTSNPAAHAFYRKIGYEEFGRLENGAEQEPAGHCRWFMKKALLARTADF